MSAVKLNASLALWRRRLAYRTRRLATVRKAAHSNRVVTAKEAARIHKWERLLAEAQHMIAVRNNQLSAVAPLREKAWREMQHFIDLKVTEHGGNNHGVEVEKIIRANGGTPGEPWCGDTVAACYLRAGAKSVTRAWASVSWLNRVLSYVPAAAVRRGHVVTYTFDHTGLFKEWDRTKGRGWFLAGEGNTGNAGAVSDSQTGGDGVKLKSRHISQVAAFRAVRN